MTHLRIELNESAVEYVSSAVIKKLYDLATSGDLDVTSNLLGTLHAPATYLEYIDAIEAEYPNCHISATKYYLYMGDPTFTLIMATRYGDGTGCVLSDCLNVRDDVQTAFAGLSGNTDITDATGMKYFTNISWARSNAGWYNGLKGCTNLQRCELPEGMLYIGSGSGYNQTGFFKGCSNLTYVKIPSTATIIGYNTFDGCSSLLSIDLPNGLNEIANEAFYNSGLTQITIPSTVTNIGNWAFASTQLTSIHFPSSVTNIGKVCLSKCYNLTSITFDLSAGSPLSLNSGGGYMYGIFVANNTGDANLTHITKLDFPERLISIGSGQAFAGLPNLRTIIFRSSTPPSSDSSQGLIIDENCIIYVPDASVTTYQSDASFSRYSSQIKGLSELPQS